jgi:hypothetical protein
MVVYVGFGVIAAHVVFPDGKDVRAIVRLRVPLGAADVGHTVEGKGFLATHSAVLRMLVTIFLYFQTSPLLSTKKSRIGRPITPQEQLDHKALSNASVKRFKPRRPEIPRTPISNALITTPSATTLLNSIA